MTIFFALVQGKGCSRDQGLSVYSALTIPTGAQEDFAPLPFGMDRRQRKDLGQPTTMHVIQSQEYTTDRDPRLVSPGGPEESRPSLPK